MEEMHEQATPGVILAAPAHTFTNPIVPRGQDPYVVHYRGYYYLIMSDNERRITIRRSRGLSTIGYATPTIVWQAPPNGRACAQVWAPELALLDGTWYIYFAASNGDNSTHRMYVLEGRGGDPLGPYGERGKIAAATDAWAIDGTVLEYAGTRYFIWSGWPGDHNVRQNLYIARMSSAWTLCGDRVLLSTPTAPWEIPTRWPAMHEGVLPAIQEGPAVLQRRGHIFLTYSANGSWCDDYCLGMLTLQADKPMDPLSWIKSPAPVFAKNPSAGVYGPGHNSFIHSPDGTEDWLVYHANLAPGSGWAHRTVLAQRFAWTADGFPDFGRPVGPGRHMPVPAGEEQDLMDSAEARAA